MRKEKGITLVALIITIIVMMILVAVSVAIVINSDLLGTAKNAGTAYRANMDAEQSMGKANIKINDEDTTMAQYMEIINPKKKVNFYAGQAKEEFSVDEGTTWFTWINSLDEETLIELEEPEAYSGNFVFVCGAPASIFYKDGNSTPAYSDHIIRDGDWLGGWW